MAGPAILLQDRANPRQPWLRGIRQTFLLMDGSIAATEQATPNLRTSLVEDAPALVASDVNLPVQSDVQVADDATNSAIHAPVDAGLSAQMSNASTDATLKSFADGQQLAVPDLVTVERVEPERKETAPALGASSGATSLALGDNAPDAVATKDEVRRRNGRAETNSSASVSVPAGTGDQAASVIAGGAQIFASWTPALGADFASAPLASAASPAAVDATASAEGARNSLAAALGGPTASFTLVGATNSVSLIGAATPDSVNGAQDFSGGARHSSGFLRPCWGARFIFERVVWLRRQGPSAADAGAVRRGYSFYPYGLYRARQ